MWLVAASFVVVAFIATSLWLSRTRKLDTKSLLASGVIALWVAGVAVKLHFDQSKQASSPVAALASIAWPLSDSPPTNAAVADPTEVAPVDSMVAGLERRLAEQPDDPNGWALLAQSYAFVGDVEAAERTVVKAVALGVDEQTLRERVTLAKRERHPAIPGASTMKSE